MTEDATSPPLNGYTIRIEDLSGDLREIAERIGLDALLDLADLRGGEPFYLPKKERMAIAARDRAIINEFNGRNVRELAKKYNLTSRWVRAIIARQRSASAQIDKPAHIQLSII